MLTIAIIPARMGSSRFPGKPLAKIHGIPMIGHVYLRTKMCSDLVETYVATCDKEIYDYIVSIGGKVVMTSSNHERCSDRTAEALLKIEKSMDEQIDVVCMVQGDEPMVTPYMISESLFPFSDTDRNIVNLMSEIRTIKEFEDPNEVKVVVDCNNNALYFSREPIPSRKKNSDNVRMLKQVCVIPFRRDYLLHFNNLEETELELIESIDMMRILENGENVYMVETDIETYSVDTPEDLKNVELYMEKDKLLYSYPI